MDIVIKNIDIDDSIHREGFTVLFDEYLLSLPVERNPSLVNQLFNLSYFRGFLCFIDNKPAGFAVCFESYSTYRARKILNIHDFMISARYRGFGVGKRQLAVIEQYCRDNGYLKITLEVDDENTAAQRLYSSHGYEDYQVAIKGLNHWQKYLL